MYRPKASLPHSSICLMVGMTSIPQVMAFETINWDTARLNRMELFSVDPIVNLFGYCHS